MSILVLPIITFASRALILKIRKSSHEEVNELLHLSDRSLDRLLNVDLVQISNNEGREVQALGEISELVRRHGFATRVRSYFIPRVVDVINSTGIVALGCIAVFLFTTVEASSLGRLSVFFISLRRLSSHVEQLTAYLSNLVSGLPLLEKILWVFDNKEKSFISGGDVAFHGVKEHIEFKDVHFSYGKTEVLKGVNISIEAGKILAIVGPTGSGKSTLVKLFARFYDVGSGEILIDGRNIKDFSLDSLRRGFAMVDQSAAVVSGTFRENICFGLKESEYSQSQIEQAAREAHIHDFIVSLPRGYDTLVGGEGVRLSGGEAQRIAIARAFLKDPEVLILDEPTSALDASTESLVQEAVKKISRGRTVFVVAHRLSTIMDADRVVVLKDGLIAEEGSVEELVKLKGTFYEYSELQNLFY
jgi:ABC-type multidrug transport system fused ATPase/permease subunit